MAYRYGLVAVTLTWSSAVAMLVGTIFLAGRWRRARILSPVEFLEARYNTQVRQVMAWAGLPLKIIDDDILRDYEHECRVGYYIDKKNMRAQYKGVDCSSGFIMSE